MKFHLSNILIIIYNLMVFFFSNVSQNTDLLMLLKVKGFIYGGVNLLTQVFIPLFLQYVHVVLIRSRQTKPLLQHLGLQLGLVLAIAGYLMRGVEALLPTGGLMRDM